MIKMITFRSIITKNKNKNSNDSLTTFVPNKMNKLIMANPSIRC